MNTVSGRPRVAIVDLCFSERIPNVAVGYLVAGMRRAGIEVSVISPFSLGARGYRRDLCDTRRDDLLRRLYFSTNPVTVGLHETMRRLWSARTLGRTDPAVLAAIRDALGPGGADLLMVTAYLEQHPSVVRIGRLAAEAGKPFLLGGPAFNLPRTVRAWSDVPGLTAIVGAEMDLGIADLVAAAVSGRDLAGIAGVHLPDGRSGGPAAPLGDLSRLPAPDYSDFPWSRYEHRIAPVMTGRGCEWGKCLFCSDVTSVNGAGFRSRGWPHVAEELAAIPERYGTGEVMFIDIKLNSDLAVWYGLAEHYQALLPGGQWIGTVHVDRRADNGLSARALERARASGMARISCGLETGSQRLNNRMAKNTDVERLGRFYRDAKAAGISTRASMMVGFPGETASDLDQTVRFLEDHAADLDRVRLSRFKAIPGTEFERQHRMKPELFPGLTEITWDHRQARGVYRYLPASRRDYRRSKARLLDMVQTINARPLPEEARVFNGLM